KQVAGHDLGEEITSPDHVAAYLKALAAAAPDRARVVEYARSEEGRPLHVLVLGSPERLARIDEVKKGLRALADPRGLAAAEAERLLAELPAVVWLVHAVHGNEISSPDAALALAHHLLAARSDAAVDLVRREAIVLVDPLQNPDGRARFLAANRLGRAAVPDPEPASAEHDEGWPGGRSNHYLFDMNRDWFARTQPESRGRVRLFLEWFPHVTVDLHEMGGDSTYFFAPPAEPLNPHVTRAQTEWHDVFGRAIAARFDAAGQAYFVREVFDAFYPGYGETWPLAQGSIGMTFEQASARGLVWRREDGSELTFLDGIHNHFRAALATVEAAARGREKLLRDFLDFRRSAIAEGEAGPVRQYVLPPGPDRARLDRLAGMLAEQGVEVRVASGEIRGGGRAFPAGSIVVPLGQPASRLVRNLLDPRVSMDEAFVKEQERRRKKRLPDEIYDVTAWSLPLLFDVECVGTGPLVGETRPFVPGAVAEEHALAAAKVAWLLPWGTGTAAAVAEAVQAGLKVRVAERGFQLAGRAFPAGTAIVRVAENPESARETLGRIARRHGAEVAAADTGYVEGGVSLGSGRVRLVDKPRVLLAWDRPTSSLSAGWARWVLERRYGQAVTAVRVASLARVELARYDVLVLPSADYGDSLGPEGVKRIRDWVSAGGTLVALGEASRWLTREKVALLDTKTELRDGQPEAEPSKDEKDKADEPPAKGKDGKPQPFDLEKAIQPERERPDPVPGALLRVALDPEHWLSAGTDGEIHAVVESRRVFTPLKLDKGTNVGVYAKKDQVVASGLVWDDVRDLLAQKAFLMHQPRGEGHVIAFAEDPNYRGYAEATELLFMNAVLLGPAY
ncbi:MAG TPA: M14 family metallopeptidase, partial [Vicinamibacteria bacterium]